MDMSWTCRGHVVDMSTCQALKDKGLEIIFVSGDRDDESFKSYFAEMPWLAVDFSEKDWCEILCVHSVPAKLVLSELHAKAVYAIRCGLMHIQ